MRGLLLSFGLLLFLPACLIEEQAPPEEAIALQGAQDELSAEAAAERYRTLDQQYQDAQGAFFEALRKAESDEERQKAYAKAPQATFAPQFLELARSAPASDTAEKCISWLMTFTNDADSQNGALEILERHHIESGNIGNICSSLLYSASPRTEHVLRAVAEKNPHADVQGIACLTLGRYLCNAADYSQRLKSGGGEMVQQFVGYFGRERVDELLALDAEATVAEAEKLFERVQSEYGDQSSYRGTLGDQAKAELFELHNLAIGKVAPNIEGEDIFGERFQLTDYRGKVIVIDFWGHW